MRILKKNLFAIQLAILSTSSYNSPFAAPGASTQRDEQALFAGPTGKWIGKSCNVGNGPVLVDK